MEWQQGERGMVTIQHGEGMVRDGMGHDQTVLQHDESQDGQAVLTGNDKNDKNERHSKTKNLRAWHSTYVEQHRLTRHMAKV